MKNKKLLNQKLKSYAAVAVAVIAAHPSGAQVIYTDVNPDEEVNSEEFYEFDLNNDGDFDFELSNINSGGVIAMNVGLSASNAIAVYTGSVLGTTFPFVSALNEGEEIGPDLNWFVNLGTIPLLWGSYPFLGSFGEWDNLANKYVGLRVKISGNDHYGWARLDVSHTKITLKDYAYNATANEPISSMETGIELLDSGFNPSVYSYEEGIHIELPNNVVHADVLIFDMSGKLLLNESISNTANILMSNFTKGMYLIRIHADEKYFSTVFTLK